MSTKELGRKIIDKQELIILDVRNEDAFEEWKIEGERFEYINIPYFDLLDGVEELVEQLPKNKEILVVCAKEGSSIMVAEMLNETGLSVFYLAGGMRAWSEYLEPIKIADLKGGGELYQFVRLGKGCLSYMVISEGSAIIIDSSRMIDVYIEFAKKKHVTITDVLDTHLHADHISGGRSIAERTGATYWLPLRDAQEVTFPYKALESGKNIQVGQSSIIIDSLYTPGHTIGSTSFIIDETFLLTGDILFIDSIGRPDLAGFANDWVSDLRESLYERYTELSTKLVVLPAHFMAISELNKDGSVSKELGLLFKQNHGLNIESENEFQKMVTENLPPQPNAYEEIRKTNMGKLSPKIEKQQEMETGPNRCAVK